MALAECDSNSAALLESFLGRGTLAPSRMLNALRYYWIIAKGYRLQPWKSPYVQWRLETFFGKDAANLDARKFFGLMWRERKRMERFLEWVAEQRRELRERRG